jgi:hypothetical protein
MMSYSLSVPDFFPAVPNKNLDIKFSAQHVSVITHHQVCSKNNSSSGTLKE